MRVLVAKFLPGSQGFCGYESISETCLYVNLRTNPKGLDLGFSRTKDDHYSCSKAKGSILGVVNSSPLMSE